MSLSIRLAFPESREQTAGYIMTDEDVILQYRSTGNKSLLSPLFKKYSDKLFGLAYYYLSERESALDSVMEAYEVVLKSIDTKEITYFKGWMMSICRNICLKKLRDTKRVGELTENLDVFVESEEDTVYNDENIEKLLTLITKLKDNQRKCVELFYLQQMSYAQVSEQTGLTFKEVKSHIQNGKRKLKLMFEEK